MRISDWRSDVCSSDLGRVPGRRADSSMAGRPARPARPADRTHATPGGAGAHLGRTGLPADRGAAAMNRKQTFVLAGVALLLLLAGFGLGLWWAGETSATSPTTAPPGPAPGAPPVPYLSDPT